MSVGTGVGVNVEVSVGVGVKVGAGAGDSAGIGVARSEQAPITSANRANVSNDSLIPVDSLSQHRL